jgi:hypothetical protein
MSEITLDSATAATVANSFTTTRLCDPQGRTVAYALGASEYEAWKKSIIEWAKTQTTNEELLRRAAEGGTKTMEDVLKLLEAV